MPNQYDEDRAAVRAKYKAGKISYDDMMCQMQMIDCDEYADPRACVECMRKADAKMRGKKGKKT